MILYLDDWARYPRAIADMKTRNQSFVRLAQVYRAMGVKNHMFLLALHNPDLQGVDPYSPDLTPYQMLAIAHECKENPWYFFREVARAPAIGGDLGDPFQANRANISLYWCFFNHVFYILIQPRQTGKSFSTDVLMRLLLDIICLNTDINLMTKDDDLRRKNIQRLKDIAEELPKYLQMKTRDDANNGEEITVVRHGNSYNTHVPQASAKLALNMGRGLTTSIMHIDEPPFQRNISLALPAALAAMGAATDKAAAAGAPYGVIMTTTAGKKDDKDGKYIYSLLQEAATWNEIYLDAVDQKDLYRMIGKNSKGGVIRINGTFDHRQLGKDDEWLLRKLQESLAKGDDANRDYFNIWTSGTESSPFTPQVADRIAKSYRPVTYSEISSDGYITRWYIPEHEVEERMRHGQFILGMDTSEASGGDDISLVLVDLETLETIGAGSYNETNLIAFAKWLVSWLVKYPNLTAIIERRSTGAMIMDYLLYMLPQHNIDPFRRMYNKVVQDSEEYPDRWKEIRQPMSRRDSECLVRYKKTFGFATSNSGATSRGELYGNTMQLAIKRAGDKMHDKQLIDQILGLVIRNGRIDHEVGAHDDLVIGWLLAQWFVQSAKHLDFYGIDTTRVGSMVVNKETVSREELFFRQEQQQVREQINLVYQQLLNEEDDYVSLRLEQELRRLDRMLVVEEHEVESLDELLRKIREDKRLQRTRRMGAQDRMYQEDSIMNYYGNNQVTSGYSDRPMGARQMYQSYY